VRTTGSAHSAGANSTSSHGAAGPTLAVAARYLDLTVVHRDLFRPTERRRLEVHALQPAAHPLLAPARGGHPLVEVAAWIGPSLRAGGAEVDNTTSRIYAHGPGSGARSRSPSSPRWLQMQATRSSSSTTKSARRRRAVPRSRSEPAGSTRSAGARSCAWRCSRTASRPCARPARSGDLTEPNLRAPPAPRRAAPRRAAPSDAPTLPSEPSAIAQPSRLRR
jgi:hypothetical protein